jgi:hypothetical protein
MAIDHPTQPEEIRIETDIRKPTYIQSLRGHRDRESKCVKKRKKPTNPSLQRNPEESLTSKN